MPAPPAPDTKRIQTIIDHKLPSKGILEVDHFYTLSMIGEKHTRKACMRIALAIEAKTALALPPQVSTPEESTGDILQRLVLGAIEASGAIPSKIYVRDREYKSLLAPLARALDFEIAIPGRGEPKTRADIQAFRTKMATLITRCTDAVKAGATKDTLAMQVDTADLGWKFNVQVFGGIYDEITKNGAGKN